MKYSFKSSIDKDIKSRIVLIDTGKQLFDTSKKIASEYGVKLHSSDIPGTQLFRSTDRENDFLHLIDIKDLNSKKDFVSAFLNAIKSVRDFLSESLIIDARIDGNDSIIQAIVEAMELSNYHLYQYKSDQDKKFKSLDLSVQCIVEEGMQAEGDETAHKHAAIVKYQMKCMDLVNGPSNKIDPDHFASWLKDESKDLSIKTTILRKKEIVAKKLHGLLSVNKGSGKEPAFLILEYYGDPDDGKTLGLVGKGVTFDTGGVSIKPDKNMHYMKSDMGGAAAVLNATLAIAALGWKINIVAITPITENCVDGESIRPGDVIDSYSGKTIEVIHTDAEGRLILADALSYMAKNFEVDHIIDLATLTGSAVMTFGYAAAASFSNDDDLMDRISSAGLACSEKTWSLPLWETYGDQMKSDIADIKNMATLPMAGAITAAKFLEFFIEEHPSWAHLDIAGTSFGETHYSKDKAATGYGVQLLCYLAEELSGS